MIVSILIACGLAMAYVYNEACYLARELNVFIYDEGPFSHSAVIVYCAKAPRLMRIHCLVIACECKVMLESFA